MVKTGFLCDICSMGYPDVEQAGACEKSHSQVIIDPVYHIGEAYPAYIRAIMIDMGKQKGVQIYQKEGTPLVIEEEEGSNKAEGHRFIGEEPG